jgi:O-antigen/teichoic acid export membrane protein
MKTLSPFAHGFSHGASLLTDISGTRFNPAYVREVSKRYSRDAGVTEKYMKGTTTGMTVAGIISLLALLLGFLAIIMWNAEPAGLTIILLWQGLLFGNSVYAIRYEREFMKGNV